MPEQLWFTEILNRVFAGPVVSLLRALHIEPKYPQAPITDAFAMEFLVFVVLLVLFLLVRSRLSVDDPGGLQHVFENVEGFIQGQSNEIIGHYSEGYTPFLAALLFFILFSNLIGVIPGFESPTAVPVVPLGCALCAFVYYQTQGFKHAGIGYLKHFLGPSDPTMSIFIRLPLALLTGTVLPLDEHGGFRSADLVEHRIQLLHRLGFADHRVVAVTSAELAIESVDALFALGDLSVESHDLLRDEIHELIEVLLFAVGIENSEPGESMLKGLTVEALLGSPGLDLGFPFSSDRFIGVTESENAS